MNEDAVIACADLAGRAGAQGFEIGHVRDDVPVAEAGWYAVAVYRGARLMADEHPSPSLAATALAERLLRDAACRCGRRVVLSGRAGCRWRLMGPRWEPSCTAPPITIAEGQRGDGAALTAAMEARRRAARRGGRPGR